MRKQSFVGMDDLVEVALQGHLAMSVGLRLLFFFPAMVRPNRLSARCHAFAAAHSLDTSRVAQRSEAAEMRT